MQDPAQLAVPCDEYFINSAAEIAHNFPSTTATILEADDRKPSFSIQPMFELKTQAIINSHRIATAKDIYGMDSKML